MRYLHPQDICHVEVVCRSWQAGLNEVICTLHKEHHLPEVEGGEFNIRNFAVLAMTGLDEKQIRALYSKYIGEPVGKTPFVTKFQIEELCKPDPDQPEKRKFETHTCVILFPAVKRSFGKGETAALDEKNRLTIKEGGLDSEEKELTIPISICNIVELFKHPKAGKENGPVFSYVVEQVLDDQAAACLESPGIVFVRWGVPEDSRDKSGDEQKARLLGIPVADFIPLMIPCGFDILETGTCSYVPTGIHQSTFARTSDIFVINTKGMSNPMVCQWALGGFVPSQGIRVLTGGGNSATRDQNGRVRGKHSEATGAIPMIPAEVQPVVVGSLDICNDRKSNRTRVLPYSQPLRGPLANGRQRL